MQNLQKNNRERKSLINYSLEAEILGCPLSTTVFDGQDAGLKTLEHVLMLDRNCFAQEKHRILFDAYSELSNRKLSPSIPHLCIVLKDLGKWSESDSGINSGFLHELQHERAGVPAELPMLCFELRDIYWKRSVAESVRRLDSMANDWNIGVTRSIGESLDELCRLYACRPNGRQSPSDIGTLVAQELAEIEDHVAGKKHQVFIPTQFSGLDFLTGGLRIGNLVVLAAHTSVGKTALAADITVNTIRDGVAVGYFSFEMTNPEILQRLLSKMSRIPLRDIIERNFTDTERKLYRHVANQMADLPMFQFDKNLTPREIEQQVQQINRKIYPKRIRLVVVDHLHLTGKRSTAKFERRDLEIAHYTGFLKDLAKENECCVLLLSQLNRNHNQRKPEEKLPQLSDLRDSGAIEQDADIVLGLHRSLDDPKKDSQQVTLAVLKNRNGPLGQVSLKFTPELAQFSDKD